MYREARVLSDLSGIQTVVADAQSIHMRKLQSLVKHTHTKEVHMGPFCITTYKYMKKKLHESFSGKKSAPCLCYEVKSHSFPSTKDFVMQRGNTLRACDKGKVGPTGQ